MTTELKPQWTRDPGEPGYYWLKQENNDPWITEVAIIAGTKAMEFGDGSWDMLLPGFWCPVSLPPPIPEHLR